MNTPGPWKVEARGVQRDVVASSTSHNRGCVIARCYGPDAEANATAIAELGKREPVAWRYRYVYSTGASPWRIRQTLVKAYPATDRLAAREVEELYR